MSTGCIDVPETLWVESTTNKSIVSVGKNPNITSWPEPIRGLIRLGVNDDLPIFSVHTRSGGEGVERFRTQDQCGLFSVPVCLITVIFTY